VEILALFQIILTEIHPTPAAGEPEWIECIIKSDQPAVLEDVLVCDNRSCVQLPRVKVVSGQYLLITRDAEALREMRELPPITIVVECNLPSLNNSSDRVELRGRDSSVIDSMHYLLTAVDRGRSIERHGTDVNGVVTYSRVWTASAAFDSATPGRVNSHVEYERDVGVTGYFIQDSTLVVGVCNYGRQESAAQDIYLSIGTTSFVRRCPVLPAKGWWSTPIDLAMLQPGAYVRHDSIMVDLSQIDMRSDNNHYSSTIVVPPVAGSIVITEVLAEPHDQDCDFIEIFNGTSDTIDMAGWIIEDTGGELVRIHGKQHLPPGAYMACASDTAIARMCNGASWAFVRPLLNIHAQSDTISLRTLQGFPVATACYNRTWHSQVLVSTKGRSLERRATDGIDQGSSAWGSSTTYVGSTPGRTNSIAHQLVIGRQGLWAMPSPFSTDEREARFPCIIRWELPMEQGVARMFAHDVNGSQVAQILNGEFVGRSGSVTWDGRSGLTGLPVPIGVYIIVFEAVDGASSDVIHFTCLAVVGDSK